MYRKDCPKCKEPSFSAGKDGEWLCPNCGHDLSEEKAKTSLEDEK